MVNGKDGKDVMLEFWVTLFEVGFEKLGRAGYLKVGAIEQHRIFYVLVF